MSGNMADKVITDIKDNIQRKIEAGDINGDINQQLLIMVADTHNKVETALDQNKDTKNAVEDNIAFKVGTFVKDSPMIAWAVAQITTLVLVATSLAIVLGILEGLGLAVVAQP